MQNYVVLLNEDEMRVEKIFASGYDTDKRLSEVIKEWVVVYYSPNPTKYDVIVAQAENVRALRSLYPNYSGWDTAERHGAGHEDEDCSRKNGVRNYILLINETKMEVKQIWISDVETKKNITDISKKVGVKFTSLPKEHGIDFNVMVVRAKSVEEAKLQLSSSNGDPYHTGWYTAERHEL